MNRNSNCETCQPLISAMLDGELTTAENDELDLHLQQCADCQIQVERFRAVNGAVRQLSNPTIVKTELSKQVMSRSFSIWRTIPLAAAATLLVCLAIGTWPNPQPAKAEHVSAEQFVKPMEDLAYLNLQEQSDQELMLRTLGMDLRSLKLEINQLESGSVERLRLEQQIDAMIEKVRLFE